MLKQNLETFNLRDPNADLDLFTKYPVLLIPSGGLSGLNTPSIKQKLSDYVAQGGTIICFSQQYGEDYQVLPRNLAGYGFREDQSCWSNAVYIQNPHPIFSGQTKVNMDANCDGYFISWPETSLILLNRTKNGLPSLLLYPFGSGTVIVSSLYSDWGYARNHVSNQERILIRDMIAWAKSGIRDQGVLKVKTDRNLYTRGDKVQVDVDLKSMIDYQYPASLTVKILDPSNKIIFAEDRDIGLGSRTEAFSFSIPDNAIFGYYTIKAEVVREGEKIGLSSTYFEIPKPSLFINNLKLPDTFTKGTNTISFVVENRGVKRVENSTLSYILNAPDKVEMERRELKMGALEPGETVTISSEFFIPELMFGIYRLDYCLNYDEGDTEVGKKLIPCSLIIKERLDKPLYKSLEGLEIEIETINNGRFLLKDIDVVISIPDYNFVKTQTLTLLPNGTEGFIFKTIIPETTTAGVHNVVIDCNLSDIHITKVAVFISFEIPGQAVDGSYTLEIVVDDDFYYAKMINISGINATIDIRTEKDAYLANEEVKALLSLDNLNKKIENGSLSVKIFGDSERWVHYTSLNTFIRAIAINGDDIWFGTNQGLWKYNKRNGKWMRYTAIDGYSISAIAVDGDYLWLGTAKGVIRYNKLSDTLEAFPNPYGLNEVRGIVVQGSWVFVAIVNQSYQPSLHLQQI
ncbi:MAG: hypothetical protein QME07_02030 [bacterium]|nr:hypothetical protein [bacterium]